MIVTKAEILQPGKFINKEMPLAETIHKFLEVAKSGIKENIDLIYTEYVSLLLNILEDEGKERQFHYTMAVADSNIGYLSGYLSDEGGAIIRNTFKTPHPVFGYGSPSAEEALDAGMKMADEGIPEIKILPNNRKWNSKTGVIIV